MVGDCNAVTILAPRELKDLVYRCCRVQGVDPGNADRFADNVVHSEIHRGASVGMFLWLLAGSSSITELVRWTTAADQVELAEVAAHREGVATASFTSKVPLLTLSGSLWQAAERGVASVGVLATAPSDLEFMSIGFVVRELDEAERIAAHTRYLAAHQRGLVVATSALEALESRATGFLVAESTLDAIRP